MRLLALLALFSLGCNPDKDDDGFRADEDCDDTNSTIHPDAPEVCDGIDNDCDGDIDADDADVTDALTYYADGDADGYALDGATAIVGCDLPADHAEELGDCDDADPDISPGESEVCDDGVDNNCSGNTDCADGECLADAVCKATVDSVAPALLETELETELTITGEGFEEAGAGDTTVTVGGVACANVTVVDDTTVVCDAAPVAAGGSLDVVLANAHGEGTVQVRAADCLWVGVGRAETIGTLSCIDLDASEVIEVSTLSHPVGSMVFRDGQLEGLQNTKSGPVAYWLGIDIYSGVCTEVGALRDSVETTAIHTSVPDATMVGSRVLAWSENSIGGGYDDLVEINPTSGTVTKITNDTAAPYTSATGLATDPEGNLFLLASGLAGTVYSLNPVTGANSSVGTATMATGYRGSSAEATWHRGDVYALNCGSGAAGACELVVGDDAWAFTSTGIELPVASAALASRNP